MVGRARTAVSRRLLTDSLSGVSIRSHSPHYSLGTLGILGILGIHFFHQGRAELPGKSRATQWLTRSMVASSSLGTLTDPGDEEETHPWIAAILVVSRVRHGHRHDDLRRIIIIIMAIGSFQQPRQPFMFKRSDNLASVSCSFSIQLHLRANRC